MSLTDQLKREAKRAGAELKHCGNHHYQIRGECLVNYWPLSRRRTAHVRDGDVLQGVTPKEAVALARPVAPHRRSQEVDDPNVKKIKIYTDGSCLKNPGGPGGWAWASECGEHAFGSHPETTNNRMEMQAVIEAMRFIPAGPSNRLILTDSKYVREGLKSWRAGWERRQFAGIKNLAFWLKLFELWDARPGINVEWVPGHAGVAGNELVDQLAGEAARARLNPIIAALDYSAPYDSPVHLNWR